MFYGFCESLDLFEEYSKIFPEIPSEINILLFGGGDPRFILKTLSKSYKHESKINFYVLDGSLELTARNLLLIGIALENQEDLSIKAKTHLYMDIFGNSLLRPSSYKYICSKSEFLTKLITDDENSSIFNIKYLKYKERDDLENIFKFWLDRKEHIFDISKYWNLRLRSNLGARYDYRNGAFDWDLSMKMRDNGLKPICSQEYKNFRETGVAFTFPEYEQCYPNKTMAASIIKNGSQYFHRGFVGDMSIGPFIPFGISCIDSKMLTSTNGQNKFRSTDITERNLFEIMFEIQEKKEYVHDEKNSHQFGSILLENGKYLQDNSHIEEVQLKKYNNPVIKTDNITVSFMSLEDVLKIQERPEMKNKFDLMFVASNYFSFLKPELVKVLREKCVLLFETKQYSLLKKEEISQDFKKIKDLAKSFDLKAITNFCINRPYSVIKYKRN